MTRAAGAGVTAFTAGFPGSSIDETAASKRVADHLGCKHVILPIEPETAADVLPAVQRAFDEPSAANSAIPLWYLSRTAAQHVKVVLCGEGGDELFLGYNRHRWAERMRRSAPLVRAAGGLSFLDRIGDLPARKLNYLRDYALRFRDGALLDSGFERFVAAVTITPPSIRAQIYTRDFWLRHDADSGQTILSGMGELQLEVSVERLRARHGVDVSVGRPQVAYRETLSIESEVTHVHKKQSGGPGQFAGLTLRLKPLPRGEGLRFVNESVGGAIPREFVPAIEAGIRRAAQVGVVAGFPTVDFEATVLDGATHERDSSSLAFELAAAAAFREAAAKARPLLLEPVMAVEVITPVEHLGDVIGDLHRRRGDVLGQTQRGRAAVVDAKVPLKEMFGYIGHLRAMTSGRAQYSMQTSHYAAAPARELAALAA